MLSYLYMCNIPPLGAFIKGTNEYIYPKIATKTTKYECPSYHKDLMIKKNKNTSTSKFIKKLLINRENKGKFRIFIMEMLQQKKPIPIQKLYDEFITGSISVKKNESDFDYEEFDFDAKFDRDKIRKNKELIDIFNEYLLGNRCVIYTQADYVHIYLVEGDDYDEFDYYGFDYFGEQNQLSIYESNSDLNSTSIPFVHISRRNVQSFDSIPDDHMPYPFLSHDVYFCDDTVTIIKKLFKKYLYFGHIYNLNNTH